MPGSTSPKLIPMRKNSTNKSGGRKLSRSSLPARLRTKAKFSGNHSGTYLDDEEEDDDNDDGLSGENDNGFTGEPDSNNRSRDRAGIVYITYSYTSTILICIAFNRHLGFWLDLLWRQFNVGSG